MLTEGRDMFTPGNGGATENDDTYVGLVGQNQNGAISNAFSTGDYIDGGAGRDKIEATVMEDQEVDSGADSFIHPRSVNVEEVHLEALALNAHAEWVNVDVGRMDSVEEFWSDNSSANLFLNDVRLGSKLSITKDITFGLRDVDVDSGLVAAFESQSLVNEGTSRVNSQVLVRVADVSTATPATPLANVNLDLGFSLDGASVLLQGVQSTDGSYNGLREAIETALAEAGLGNLVVSFGTAYNAVTVANNTVNLPFTAQEILITDPAGKVFSDVTFDYSSIAPVSDEFLVAGNAAPVEPGTRSSLIETNLVLDNAGRGSTAGDVVIGGMSNSNKVIEKLNLQVDRSSKIDDLFTGTGLRDGVGTRVAFNEIEVTSGVAQGSLGINEIGDVKSFDATAFQGENLAVGATLSSAAAYVYNTGDANTTLDVDVSNNVAAHKNFSLSITSGDGNDNITLDLGLVDPAGIVSAGHNPLINQKELGNAAINAGDGDNIVWTPGAGDVFIQTGSGNDVIYTDNTGENPAFNAGEDKAVFVFNTVAGNRGINNLLSNSDHPDSSLGNGVAQVYDTFKLSAQVTFQGIESAFVEVDYDRADYTTSTEQINQAIIKAINEHPELKHLIEAEVGRGEALIIRSLIDGELVTGDLAVDLIAPVAAVAGETAAARAVREAQGQQTVSAADLTASGLTVNDILANTTAAQALYETEFATITSGDQPATYIQTLDVNAIAADASGFFAGEAANTLNVGGVLVDLAVGDDQDAIAGKIAAAVDGETVTIGGQEFTAAAAAVADVVTFTLTPTTAVPFGTVPAAISITALRGSEEGYLSTTEPGVGFTTSGAFTGGPGVPTAQVSTFNFAGVKIDPAVATTLTFDFAGAAPFAPADIIVSIPAGAGEIQIANLVAEAFETAFGLGSTGSASVNGAQVEVTFPFVVDGTLGSPAANSGAYGVTTVIVGTPDAVIEGTVPASVAPSTSFSATTNTALGGSITQTLNFSGWEITEGGNIGLFYDEVTGLPLVTVALADGLNDVAVAAAVHAALDSAGIAGVTVNTLGTNSTTVSYTLDGATFPVGDVPTVADNTDLPPGEVSAVGFSGTIPATVAVIAVDLAGLLLGAGDGLFFEINGDNLTAHIAGGVAETDTDVAAALVAAGTITIDGATYTVTAGTGAAEVVLTSDIAGALATDLTVTVPGTSTAPTTASFSPNAGTGTDVVNFGLASKTGSVGDLVVDPYVPTNPDSIINLDGADSINETDNWVLSGSGNDVIVLSTGEYSNEVIELQGVFGKTLIVNFDDTAVARTNGGDYLDFTDYLNESGAAIEVVSGNANGNKVSIIDFNQLQGTDTGDLGASVQMGNVSGTDLAAAINANFTVTGQNVFLINNDNATDAFDNVGEYLVVSTNGSTNIQIVGTLDFGAEINDLSAANLIQF